MTTQHPRNTYAELWHSLRDLYDDGEAKAIVRLLLDRGFGLSMADIVCGKADTLAPNDQERLEALMARLRAGEPVQYVLGQADFCGRVFDVGKGVLIPRPETEELCRMVVSEYNKPYCALQPPRPLNVLDVGTGSGCIAVTLALDLRPAALTAWDVSPEALLTARANAKALGASVNFQLQDMLTPPSTDAPEWDVIVSNPPYVALHEQKEMSPNVLCHEPAAALFVPDDDPLRFYRAIARYAGRALRKGGKLFFEINPLYVEEMRQMLSEVGFAETYFAEDAFGKTRFCRCTLASPSAVAARSLL